jgi:hypothetical protein
VASIRLKSHVGPDGTLHLNVPTEFRETDVEVVVTLTPIEAPPQPNTDQLRRWPDDFFENTFGACKEEPLIRLPQGEPEVREALSWAICWTPMPASDI